MIRGVDVWVSFASEENGYVELTPEAASNPWAMIGRHNSYRIYRTLLLLCESQFIPLQRQTEVSTTVYVLYL